MATFSINGIGISGICCAVPKNIENNEDYSFATSEDKRKFIENTGINFRRIAGKELCTSDLCVEAGEKLIKDLNWSKSDIEILVFVTQTPDYILPITATILQDRLGLSKECMAFDIPLGCSGYVYGLSIIAGMMKASNFKKGLLLVGDTISKIISNEDKSTKPLFGDAGSATALELSPVSKPMHFDLGTDGSGYKAIWIPHGGSRTKSNVDSYKLITYEKGVNRNQCQLFLDGMDVFSFGITQAPKTVNKLLSHFNLEKDSIDYFIFHQANLMMNKMITKKLKLSDSKVPYSLKNFGNTSSATIPLTIVTELKDRVANTANKLILCGFGVGLSWGTVFIETDNLICSDLIEI